MKLLVKAVCIVTLLIAIASAQPNTGDQVLPSHDFTMYSYLTPDQPWNLAQHHDGNTCVALITGSIC